MSLINHNVSDKQRIDRFVIVGLSLGGGLIVLASALSEASWDWPQTPSYSATSKPGSLGAGLPQYQYGWCLQLSGLALILSEIAALLTISGYMARFPTVEDMVRQLSEH